MRRGCEDVCTIFAEGLIQNAENQITQMDGGAAVYGYDGEGRRMKKTVGSETTYSFYGPVGLLCEFTTTSGVTQAASTDRATYGTSERLGTAVLLMNASGVVVENNRTLPYGESWLTDVGSVNKKKFTTYERDQESSLDYALNRFYANSMGRFTTVDSGRNDSQHPLTMNRYLYVTNDPINLIDPEGLELTPAGLHMPGWSNPCQFHGGSGLPPDCIALKNPELEDKSRVHVDIRNPRNTFGDFINRLICAAVSTVTSAASPRNLSTTVGVGVSGSGVVGAGPGAAVTGSVHVVADPSGNVAVVVSVGGNTSMQGNAGVGGSVGVSVLGSSGQTINQLGGRSSGFTGNAGPVAADVSFSNSATTATVGGPAAGGSIAPVQNYSFVIAIANCAP